MNAVPAVRRISIFDTTLRDGEQAPGNAMSTADKLELALRLEALGVDCVEAGFPASSPNDFEATRAISQALTRIPFATLCRAVRSDVATAVEAGGAANHVIQIMGTGSDVHLEHKRGITRKEAIAELVDTAIFAKSLGVEVLGLGIEDATRGDPQFLQALTESAVEAGADYIPVADTSGCMTPNEFGDLIGQIRTWAPAPVRIGLHCHNDFGLALANSVAGLEAGADDVQVTLGGIGERAGNTALEELCALIAYKGHKLGLSTGVDLTGMYSVYNRLREVIRLEEPRTKAIFGRYAFGTAAGIHQHGMLRNPETYEYVEPAQFGRDRSLLISRHSGRAVLRYLLEQIDVHPDEEQLAELYRIHIAERVDGDCEDMSVVQARLAAELSPAYSGASA
ncbi:LeuA family protein [Jatrophihabitans lederbergiae]|uniref:2-isopropylmalate synthase n=1 Tax=Jatrophihabitans lederbergiae TaxID=3075547 RepID=A0ABU2J610_9ACTN|nr:LeuA family protein [Jatrophihabitans sp. DSM 44399]MDT0260430.1 LeuA family protein [Jatrophihabitans sp. DSM 44399]